MRVKTKIFLECAENM